MDLKPGNIFISLVEIDEFWFGPVYKR